MHNSYFFLRQLSIQLKRQLKGFFLRECFTQSSNELVIRLEYKRNVFFIRAALDPSFPCLSFPESYNRASKNSVNLFTEVNNMQVADVEALENERSLLLTLQQPYRILFKMHGVRSNVILVSGQQPVQLFRTRLKNDMNISVDSLRRKIDWSRASFDRHHDAYRKYFNPLGKPVWDYFDSNSFDAMSPDRQGMFFEETVARLMEPDKYYITELDDAIHLHLLETGNVLRTHTAPLAAADDLFSERTRIESLRSERAALLRIIDTRLMTARRALEKNRAALQGPVADDRLRLYADLIMANLETIRPDADLVKLHSFGGDELEIPLRAGISPQKNAEIYYRKARNQSAEVSRLKEIANARSKEMAQLESDRQAVEQATQLSAIRTIGKRYKEGAGRQPGASALPYREVVHMGYVIRIGKSAKANDELTLRHTSKDDLWLHARDVPGSHVVVKSQAGRRIPRPVVERAAQLAAWHSRRRTDSLCPVILTQRKYVSKRKKDPPGAVHVLREEVIMVKPCDWV